MTGFTRNELDRKQQKAVTAYWKKCLQRHDGPHWNSYRFKKLSGYEQIWEMKPAPQVRFLGFFHPQQRRTFVLTNGFIKKQTRTPTREIERAERARKEFLRATEGGQ